MTTIKYTDKCRSTAIIKFLEQCHQKSLVNTLELLIVSRQAADTIWTVDHYDNFKKLLELHFS